MFFPQIQPFFEKNRAISQKICPIPPDFPRKSARRRPRQRKAGIFRAVWYSRRCALLHQTDTSRALACAKPRDMVQQTLRAVAPYRYQSRSRLRETARHGTPDAARCCTIQIPVALSLARNRATWYTRRCALLHQIDTSRALACAKPRDMVQWGHGAGTYKKRPL